MSEVNTIPSTAPKSVSTFTILVDGNKISEQFKVLSIVIQKEINSITKATVLLQDGSAAEQGFTTSNSEELVPGKPIEIQAGYQNDEETVFKGITVKHSIKVRKNVSALVVECRHEAIKMTTKLNNNYFHDTKDDEIADQLCRDHGLTLKADSTQMTHKEVVQFNCTDWDFMACRAEENGFWITTTEGTTVGFKAPDFSQEPVLTLAYGATIKELDAEIDARHQYEALKSIGWSPADQEAVNSEAQDPGVPAAGNLAATDLAATTDNNELEIRHAALGAEELQIWANSTLQKQRLAKIKGKLKIDGIHTPLPGQLIELQNVGERFEGKVMVSGVRHHIEKGNWETFIQFGEVPERFAEKFELEQPLASGLLPAVQGLHIGIVTALEDPDAEERIQVRLPMVHDSDEGTWMRLCSLDAGENRGWVSRPEIADEVIVGFLNADPRFGVILGKVHSSKNTAPFPAADDNHEKGYLSREGLKLLFDDDKKSILLETPGGHKFFMNDDDSSITLEDSNGNKLIMNNSGIEIESMKDVKLNASVNLQMESGANAEIKGGANAKFEGSAAAELSSSGATTVKGSILQLN
ncbi:type VI secretion system tip protein VgrG [Flavobacteriaceae bacterium TP-CH-4]|uniref:Type VI secretion system tip protein VgrG n=1 Tax=Pelagihabitans pacificus TaxID=2696054 RepID=A0A967AQB0_9FLAO|nr:type VI secretion system tip protein VgrG [Pelagihabitans pacificus]NHF58027.1 type VI secretion system tip protein VgrG [Pelagihabitans pacificus]